MTTIPATLVKSLRDRTGLGVMECKDALAETDGDVDQAIALLRKKSSLKAEKRSARVAAEGVLAVAYDDATVVMAEVNCETDFVARDEHLQAFAQRVANQALESKLYDVTTLLATPLETARQQLIQKIGENIRVRRIAHLSGDICGAYLHTNNRKLGAIVTLNGGDTRLAKDIAMHITATNPMALKAHDIDQAIIAKEREIYNDQLRDSGKPAAMIEKIVAGKLDKFVKEVSLEHQPFVKDPNNTIQALCAARGAQVCAFFRLAVGEGIEKQQTDFASEVKAATGAL